MAGDWRRLLVRAVPEEELKGLREHDRAGRAMGDNEFLERFKKRLGRILRRPKPGRKRKPFAK